MVDDAVRHDLARFYKGCMCPTCLQTLEDLRPPKISIYQFLKQQLAKKH
jgi:hypothetical protein